MAVEELFEILSWKIPFTEISIGSIVLAIVTIIIGYIAAVYVGRYINKVMLRAKLAKILAEFTSRVVKILIIIFSISIAIGFFGIDVGAAIISISVVSGFILGFAFQETLGNLAAGFMIALTKPFRVGDFVEIGNITGEVISVGASITTLTTLDNKKVVIPNSKIWGDTVTNFTAYEQRMIDMTVGISYSDDMSKAIEIAMKVLTKHPNVLDDPAPMVAVKELGESSVDLVIRPWVKTSDYWQTRRDLTQKIKEAFDKNNVTIPFPQRDIHFFKE